MSIKRHMMQEQLCFLSGTGYYPLQEKENCHVDNPLEVNLIYGLMLHHRTRL